MVEFLRIDDRVDGISINSSYDFSANDLALFFSATSGGVAILVPVRDEVQKVTDFRFVLTNKITADLFATELVGKTLLDTLPEAFNDGSFERYLNVLNLGIPNTLRFSHQVHGNRLWITVHALKMRDTLLLSLRDITAEIALTESEERYRFMLESLPHLIWSADPQGVTDFHSRQWIDFTGQIPASGRPSGWLEFIYPQDLERTMQAWRQAIASKSPFKAEHRILNASGGYRWFKSNCQPMFNTSGEVVKWMGSSTDIHEEMIHLEELTRISRELEEKNDALERINNDLDTFVYTASHDLTAPINNIEGLTSLIRYELTDCLDDRQMEYLDLMTQSTNNLHANIRDLTEIISIKQDTGREKEAIFFDDILRNIEEDLYPVISVLKAEIITDFKVKSMLFARKNIRTILFNLISNALKYRSTERKTIVHIRTVKTHDAIILEVSDNGSGISGEQLPEMFGIFKRFHKDIHGNGVGLYMIKRIIENNGGFIQVKSEVNQGTTFQVHFMTSH